MRMAFNYKRSSFAFRSVARWSSFSTREFLSNTRRNQGERERFYICYVKLWLWFKRWQRFNLMLQAESTCNLVWRTKESWTTFLTHPCKRCQLLLLEVHNSAGSSDVTSLSEDVGCCRERLADDEVFRSKLLKPKMWSDSEHTRD